ESDIETGAVRQIADIADGVAAYRKNVGFIRRLKNQFMSGFLPAFATQINGIAPALIIGFNQERLRFAFACVVVLSPNEAVRPIAIVSKRQIVDERCGGAMSFQIRLERFGTFDVAMRNLQRQVFRRVPGNARTVGIKTGLVEVVAVFVRLAPGENAAFDFDTAPNETARGDAKCNVR